MFRAVPRPETGKGGLKARSHLWPSEQRACMARNWRPKIQRKAYFQAFRNVKYPLIPQKREATKIPILA